MKKFLLILLCIVNVAKAEQIEFDGSFFDFLVYTGLQSGTECGIDPYLMNTAGERLVRKTFSFQQRTGESIDDFLARVAAEQQLKMQKIGPYRYFSSDNTDQNASFAEALFANSADIMSAATALKARNGVVPSGSVGALVSAMAQSDDARRRILFAMDQQIRKYTSTMFRANSLKKGSPLSAADPSAAADAYTDAETQRDDLIKMFMDSEDAYINQMTNPPAAFTSAMEFLPANLVEEAYDRTLLNFLDPCLFALEQGKILDESDPSGKVIGLLKHEQSKVVAHLQESRAQAKNNEAIYAKAFEFWKNKDFPNAYRQYSLLYDGAQDYSAKTRLGYGLLAVRFQTNRVQEFQKQAAGQQSKPSFVDAGQLLGLDDAMVDALGKYLGIPVKYSPAAANRNPSRTGATYGLMVNKAAMEGLIATFGVQLSERQNPSPASRDGGDADKAQTAENTSSDVQSRLEKATEKSDDFEVQIQSQGQVHLDTYFKASISDAMRYVGGSHYPDISKKHILLLLDDSVGIHYGGDSGGAALSIAMLSRGLGKDPRADICMTGAVRAFGDVRPIGGLLLKTRAAGDRGFGAMLVPDANLAELKLIDTDSLGSLQLITGDTMEDYIRFAIPLTAEDKAKTEKIFRGYALGYILFKAGDYPESLAALKNVLQACPNHFSAASLVQLMELAGIKPKQLPQELSKFAPTASL
ncbi:MAG: S16 family serine protease [Chthoniobacteraceae bacterium]